MKIARDSQGRFVKQSKTISLNNVLFILVHLAYRAIVVLACMKIINN